MIYTGRGTTFITDDFLLLNEPARVLYHEHAKKMPIYDFHSHLDARDIYENTRFRNLTHAWLSGDHYKWRAMRALGVPEEKITGNADDASKFEAWARALPYCAGSPLYHWSLLELARVFGMHDVLLDAESAGDVYARANALLSTDGYRVRKLLERSNARVVCTTNDPLDSLECHRRLAFEASFPVMILPTFRPDRGRSLTPPSSFREWVEGLEAATNSAVRTADSFIDALRMRHEYFHESGCRISDHGMEAIHALPYTAAEINAVFKKARSGKHVSPEESARFSSFVLHECAKMDAGSGWAMQLHIGAMRNNNTLAYKALGPDSGFDSISDAPLSAGLGRFLDSLAREEKLPRTILYTLDPSRNETVVAMLGNFQEGPVRGKMQLGAAWWFNDTKDGIERHLSALSGMGLVSTFTGMATDSRSFLSFPRHEYFRRILCNVLGGWMARGELPGDTAFIGGIVRDVCFNNARNYFTIKTGKNNDLECNEE